MSILDKMSMLRYLSGAQPNYFERHARRKARIEARQAQLDYDNMILGKLALALTGKEREPLKLQPQLIDLEWEPGTIIKEGVSVSHLDNGGVIPTTAEVYGGYVRKAIAFLDAYEARDENTVDGRAS